MSLHTALVSAALISLAAPVFAAAPANAFNLMSNGKTIGNASYTISKDKNGYHVVGKFQYRLGSSIQANNNTGDARMETAVAFNEGQFNEDLRVSEDGSFLSGYTQNASNQILTSFQPNKTGTNVTVNQIQGGIGLGSHDLPMPKASFLLVPDFDPAAIQIFLTTALAHPHADKIYLFLVPSGSNPRGKESAQNVSLQLAPDIPAGTLDGKPVTLSHYVLGYHSGKADLYIDDAGNLMQADMGPLKTSYIRAKFTLTTGPAK